MSDLSKKFWYFIAVINIMGPILILIYALATATYWTNINNTALGLPSDYIFSFTQAVSNILVGGLVGSKLMLWMLGEILIIISAASLLISLQTESLTGILKTLGLLSLIAQFYIAFNLLPLLAIYN